MQHLCIYMSVMCVWGSRWNRFRLRSQQFSTNVSMIWDVIHNSENPEVIIWVMQKKNHMEFTTRPWKCENQLTACLQFCLFLFPRCASLPWGLTSASFLRTRFFSTTPSATTSSTVASRRAGRSWRGRPWLQTYTAGSWSYHRVRLGCVNMEAAQINMLFGTSEAEL